MSIYSRVFTTGLFGRKTGTTNILGAMPYPYVTTYLFADMNNLFIICIGVLQRRYCIMDRQNKKTTYYSTKTISCFLYIPYHNNKKSEIIFSSSHGPII